MKKYLILLTAAKPVITSLIGELNTHNVEKYCLIQNSLLESFQEKYKDIQFIN